MAVRKATTAEIRSGSACIHRCGLRRCGSKEVGRDWNIVAPALPRADPTVLRSNLPASGGLEHSSSFSPSSSASKRKKKKVAKVIMPATRVTPDPHAGSDLHWSGFACYWARALPRHRCPPLWERCAAASSGCLQGVVSGRRRRAITVT